MHYIIITDTTLAMVHLMCITDVVIITGVFHTSLVCVCVCDVVTQNGFHCEICCRMLKDMEAVLQHINVDTHIGRIEVSIFTDIVQQ